MENRYNIERNKMFLISIMAIIGLTGVFLDFKEAIVFCLGYVLGVATSEPIAFMIRDFRRHGGLRETSEVVNNYIKKVTRHGKKRQTKRKN